MSALIAMWRDNPVMVKELRVRMRGARAYWIITGYLVFLSFILFVRYTSWWNETRMTGHQLSGGSKVGQEFLLWLTVTQAFLVAFITPAITSGAITIEREQRTLELLELTRLSPGQIVVGKLSSAVGFMVLLLVSSIPLASICFLLGGVSPEQIAFTYVMLAAGALVAGTLGLVWSAVAKSTAAAVVLTYASLMAPFLLMFVFAMAAPTSSGYEIEVFGVHLLTIYGVPIAGADWSPLAPYFVYWDQVRYFGLVLPRWLPGMLTFGLIGIVLSVTAAVRLAPRPETRGSLLRWLVMLFVVEQMFFFFGARFSAHAAAAPAHVSQLMAHMPPTLHLLYPVLLLLILTPVFCTGDLRPAEARKYGANLLRGWSPGGWRKTRLTSGWAFMCLLTVLVVGGFGLSFVAVGHGKEAMSGTMTSVLPPPAPTAAATAGAPSPPPVSNQPQKAHFSLGKAFLMLLSTITALYFFGVFLSLACGNRWAAIMVMYAAMAVVAILPFLAYGAYRQGDVGAAPSALINLFYLNPLFSIVEMGDNTGTFWRNLPLIFGKTPPWQVTTILYAFVSVVAALLATPFVTRVASQRVLAYEDLGSRT
jgi:ABC-type transport system involved in multi-copper enzyme maturation permease subunit